VQYKRVSGQDEVIQEWSIEFEVGEPPAPGAMEGGRTHAASTAAG